MKKRILSLVLCLTLLAGLTAQSAGTAGIERLEVSVNMVNIEGAEATWLPGEVQSELEKNLKTYGKLNLVDSANLSQIKKTQAEMDTGFFDNENSIEIGKLSTATHKLFLTITKTNTTYILTGTVSNLETAEVLATEKSDSRNDAEALFNGYGSAVDELTIRLCQALGIPLNQTDIFVLMHGDRDLAAEEREALFTRQAEAFKNQMEEIQGKLDLLGDASEEDVANQQKIYEAEMKLQEEKYKAAMDSKQRAVDEAEKRHADMLMDAQRSAEQKMRIDEMRNNVNKAMSDLRSKKMEAASVLGQIRIIEAKKEALLNICNTAKEQKKEIVDKYETEIRTKRDEIVNRPGRAVELSNGVLTDAAKKRRMNEFAAIKEPLYAEEVTMMDNIDDSFWRNRYDLKNEIDSGYELLKGKKSSSLGDELSVVFSEYDGNMNGWDCVVTLKSEDQLIFQTKSFLPYTILTGKKIPGLDADDETYYAFADDVDLYNSLFLQGDPFLTFQLSYDVIPSEDEPSTYDFNFKEFKFYTTSDLKIANGEILNTNGKALALAETSISRTMNRTNDLRHIDDEVRHTGSKTDVHKRPLYDFSAYADGENRKIDIHWDDCENSDFIDIKLTVKNKRTGETNVYYSFVGENCFVLEDIKLENVVYSITAKAIDVWTNEVINTEYDDAEFQTLEKGDLLLTDGTYVPYKNIKEITKEQKEKAMAIVFDFDDDGCPLARGIHSKIGYSSFADNYGTNYDLPEQFKNDWKVPTKDEVISMVFAGEEIKTVLITVRGSYDLYGCILTSTKNWMHGDAPYYVDISDDFDYEVYYGYPDGWVIPVRRFIEF